MSILKNFSRLKYLNRITDQANDRIEKYWKEQQEKDNDTGHHIHVGDAPLVSHAQVAAVIDSIESAQQNAQADRVMPCATHSFCYPSKADPTVFTCGCKIPPVR